MKIAKVTALFLAGAVALAAKDKPETRWMVPVCMELTPSDSGLAIMKKAQIAAAAMFGEIGVRLVWHHPGSCPAGALRISLSYHTPADFHPGALAYASPYEGTHIVVFWDRVRVRVRESLLAAFTAHIVAHEITHVLQGVSHHSTTGLMKAYWVASDLATMATMPLPFTADDIDLIQRGMLRREGLAAAGER